MNKPEIPTDFISENDTICFGNTILEVIHTPGHTTGHLCFYNRQNNILISGDTLFKGSIGRTDLPGGNYEIIEKSIRQKLYILPENTIVYPGHGDSTTIERERKTNPFIKL
jgi:glyoxylase-like metal-dependent hydrolase (beta-lactamase superfamily II)